MNLKRLSRRPMTNNAAQRAHLPEKSHTVVFDLSSSKIDIEEAATLAFNARNIRSRYNNKRDYLILQFDSAVEKLSYVKKIPQWMWNRGCVVWEYNPAQLSLWMQESAE